MTNESYLETEKRQREEAQILAVTILEGKRPEGRYTIEEALTVIYARTGNYYRKFCKAVNSGVIPCYENETGDEIGDVNDLRSYLCWDDINKWITENTSIRKFRFPAPSEPATIEEVIPNAAFRNETVSIQNLPGRIPRIAIGKLAVMAAWQIECETGKRATADQVIAKLQEMAEKGEEDYLHSKIKLGVCWIPKRSKTPKEYKIEACGKTLETWHKSRD